MDTLHSAVVAATKDIRQRLADADIGGQFRLDIEVSGRIQGGDVIISYTLGEMYSSSNAKGARLHPVVDEFMRRKGWDERNAPLCLEDFTEEPAPEMENA